MIIHPDRAGDFERVKAHAATLPAARSRGKHMSLADFMLDVSIGYLDTVEDPSSVRAQRFKTRIRKQRQKKRNPE